MNALSADTSELPRVDVVDRLETEVVGSKQSDAESADAGSSSRDSFGRRAIQQARRERRRWALVGVGVMAATLVISIVAVSIGGIR